MDDGDVVWIPNVAEEPIEIIVDDDCDHNNQSSLANELLVTDAQQFKASNLETTNAPHNSHAVVYTNLIPIGEGIQNFSQLTQLNSSSRVLFMDDAVGLRRESSSMCAISKDENSDKCIEHLNKVIVKSECATNEYDTNRIETMYSHNWDSDGSEHPSEETVSADEGLQDNKSLLIDCMTANIRQDMNAVTNMSIQIEDIRSEYCNEESDSDRVVIKTEGVDFESHDNDLSESSSFNKTEDFLKRNPDVFTNFCGLPTFELFSALLEYITDDIKPIESVTKYEQLFSVLTKLHKNEDNLYLNKFVFPAVYVSVVELLHEKLAVLCKSDFKLPPAVLMPVFDCTQKVNIFGTITVRVRSENIKCPDNITSVSYLIAYSALGEVFFVSKAFMGAMDILKMIAQSGVLKKLGEDDSILLYCDDVLYVTQANKFTGQNNRPEKMCEVHSITVWRYTFSIVKRLSEHFRVLGDSLPEFMLYDNLGGSFADKLIFVCCMILNMLPRRTYE